MYWNPNGQFHRISPPEISLKEYKYYEILQKTSAKVLKGSITLMPL